MYAKQYYKVDGLNRYKHVRMFVCPSVSKQTSISVLKADGWNFNNSLLSIAGRI